MVGVVNESSPARRRRRPGPAPTPDLRPVALRLASVSKTFRRAAEEVVALRDVNLTVHAGEHVAVVGRSGSGKSTLLHLAGGLAEPDAGRVDVGDRDLSTLHPRQRAAARRRDIGFVFQFFHLMPGLTVWENVALPLVLDGERADRATARIDGLLRDVALDHRRDHLPGELSGGEMQRAAIARALVAEPALVLADEPTGNLDSTTGEAVLDVLLSTVRTRDAALLLVTHDATAAARADRVVTLADGRVTAS